MSEQIDIAVDLGVVPPPLLLRPKLEEQLARYHFRLIILDPVCEVLGNRDENVNSDIASLMNELEGLVQRTRAGLVVAHHFAKGDITGRGVGPRSDPSA